MKIITKLTEIDIDIDITFIYDHLVFSKRQDLRTFLDKMFCTKFVAVYAAKNSTTIDEKRVLYWDGDDLLLLNSNNKWLYFSNSEWASMRYV